jgi:hypothetical protein
MTLMPPGMEAPPPDLGMVPSLDAGLLPPGSELASPGMTSAANPKLRIDVPSLPADVPLKKDPVQDLPTLQSKRPAV